MTCIDVDNLWKECFRDPTETCTSKRAEERPCIDAWKVPEQSRRNGVESTWTDTDQVIKPHQEFQDLTSLFISIKDSGKQKDLHKAYKIHVDLIRSGLLGEDVYLGNALVNLYAKCGALAEASDVLHELPTRDVVAWTGLIAGYVQHGCDNEALSCFYLMQDEGLLPNAITFICMLKVCGNSGAVSTGEKLHVELVRQGLLENDTVLGTALLDMYAKCGMLEKAQKLFDELPVRDVVSWTALICGYLQHGFADESLKCFEQMHKEGLPPNRATFVCILNACSSLGRVEMGEEIHVEIRRQGLFPKDIKLGNALVDMYAKCSALPKAQEVFNELPARNVVTWTALIAGYVQHGYNDKALECFEQMQADGLSPDDITFICILVACGRIGAGEKGKEIHDRLRGECLLGVSVELGNALVDMYVGCCMLSKAQEVFTKLLARNVVTWTSLIAGHAQAGDISKVISLFSSMIAEGIEANEITFVVFFSGCSHEGLLQEGRSCFETMSNVYGIVPTVMNYTSMVDLLSRAGCIDEALSIIEYVPASNSLMSWSALMGACQKWMFAGLARCAFASALQMDETFSSAYVCMSNIYANIGH